VCHLEHAVRERPHLRAREARIHIAEPKASQAEPLVGALKIRLELRGGEERSAVDEVGAALGRNEDEIADGGTHGPRRHAYLAPDGSRRNARGEGVLHRKVLAAILHRHADASGTPVGVKAVAGHDLGEHDRGIGFLGRGTRERALERQPPSCDGNERGKRRAGLVKRASVGLDAEDGEHRREYVVTIAHGRLLGGLAAAHDGIRREGLEGGGKLRREYLHLAGGVLARDARAHDEAHVLERMAGKRDERLEVAASLRGWVGGQSELLERASHVEHAPKHAHRKRVRERVGRTFHGEHHVAVIVEDDVFQPRCLVMGDVGCQQLGRGRTDAAAQELACCLRHLR